MDDYKTNILKAIIFILVIIGLVIGGYFLVKNFQPKRKNENNKTIEETKIVKIDEKKDLIYFENYKVIATEPDITYKDVIINIKGNEELNNTLKSEMDTIRTSVKYISNEKLEEGREVLYEEENIYSAKERIYETYNTLRYMSLVIKDYDFNCYEGPLFTNAKSYIYAKKDGDLLSEEEILELYNTNLDEIKSLIRKELSSVSKEEGEELVVNVEETLNNLKPIYYIDYKGLNVYYIVKTSLSDSLGSLVIE